ncbi:MAG TPA: hypothetical protein VMK12_20050 [Anaeromyxobacteraceae bacterium]|nr:hypothetical protein [Anaeromyxobacteraceae bacterium]
MDPIAIRRILEAELTRTGGLLRLRPAWVARDFLRPGKRLGLREDQYAVGPRGFICERWLGSETEAENTIKHENEGLSFLEIEGQDLLLRDVVAACPALLMGDSYARTHQSLGRLAKIYDFESRIFFHYHQTADDARKVGRNSKEEAYFYPDGVEMGRHPETFFGVHPYIVREKRQVELLLPLLQSWDSDRILMHSRAYLNVPGEGFHLPSGLLHAPGTALTIELQEPSDVMGVLQAVVDGVKVSKRLLLHHVPPADAQRLGERAALNQLLWDENGDPFFYEHHHTPPVAIAVGVPGVSAQWIYYNTTKFSGKRFVLAPGAHFVDRERGVHNVLIWKGDGRMDGLPIGGGRFGLDEVLVPYQKAMAGVRYENTGSTPLEVLAFFGPDLNNEDVPYLRPPA